MKDQKHFSIRMDSDTLKKFQSIAKYHDRSTSRQIMRLIHECIREFEAEHGEIKLAD